MRQETDNNPMKYSPHLEVNMADTTPTKLTYIKSLESECHALRTENILLKDNIKKTSFDQIDLENNDKKVNTLTDIPTYTFLITIFNVISVFC